MPPWQTGKGQQQMPARSMPSSGARCHSPAGDRRQKDVCGRPPSRDREHKARPGTAGPAPRRSRGLEESQPSANRAAGGGQSRASF